MCRQQCRHDGVEATGDLQAVARTRRGGGDRQGAGCSADAMCRGDRRLAGSSVDGSTRPVRCRWQCGRDGVEAAAYLQAAARTRQGQGDRRGVGFSADSHRRREGRCDLEVRRKERRKRRREMNGIL